jgi:ankyrin repeat protein
MDNLKAFFQAVCDGDAAAVKQQLDESPELVNAKDEGATPLHFAAIENHRDVVDLLIAHGADLNAVDEEYNSTPAGWANEKGHVPMAHHLVAKGMKVDLPRAAAFGLIDQARELISADPFSINTSGGWGTPLHEASVWGHPEIVELLLANGGDPNLKNRDGRSALAIATHQVATNGSGTIIAIESRKQEIISNCAKIAGILKRHGAHKD